MPDELGGATLRPDASLLDRELVDPLDDPGPGHVRIAAPVDLAADQPHRDLRWLVLRTHQVAARRQARDRATTCRPPSPDTSGAAQPRRARLGQRLEERPDPLRHAPQHRVRERHGATGTCRPHELDGLVHRGVARHPVEVAELVGAEPQRSEHRGVDAGDGPPTQRLDRVVERARALHGAVREALSQRAIALVELGGRRAERAIGPGAVLEHPPHDVERGPTRRRDGRHRSPRNQAASSIRRPPSGCTSTGSNDPSSAIRARQTVTRTAVEHGARADVRRERPHPAHELLGRSVEIERRGRRARSCPRT